MSTRIRKFGPLSIEVRAREYSRLRVVLPGRLLEIYNSAVLRTLLLSWPSGAVVLTNSLNNTGRVVTAQLQTSGESYQTAGSGVSYPRGLSYIKSKLWRLDFKSEDLIITL